MHHYGGNANNRGHARSFAPTDKPLGTVRDTLVLRAVDAKGDDGRARIN